MLNEAMPECPPAICHPQVVGAFLGNAVLRDALLTRVHSRSRGPLPMPRLREMLREVALQNGLEDQADLGWPADLGHLIDTLCTAQNNHRSNACLEGMLKRVPPGADLTLLTRQFLLRLLADDQHGLIAQASGGQIGLLRQLQQLLVNDLAHRQVGNDPSDGEAATQQEWEAVHAALQLLLARTGHGAPPAEHFINLAARATAEFDAASAARWSWQAAAHRPLALAAPGNGTQMTERAEHLRNWQLDVLAELMESL